VYDILPNGQQVKCWWNEMRSVSFGDEVPMVGGRDTYSVSLRVWRGDHFVEDMEFANVSGGRFVSITSEPLFEVFDKFGEEWA